MFPTEPIRRYISLARGKKIEEAAKAYGHELVQIRLKMSPNSGHYFRSVMLAGVRLQQSNVEAYIEIVRDACREASRPVDNEVRAFMLGEIHSMLQSGRNQVIRAVAREIAQSGMKFPDSLLPALTAQASTGILAIESNIEREFKIEELKEGIKQSVEVAKPADPVPPVAIPPAVEPDHGKKSGWTRDQLIGLGILLATVIGVIVVLTVPEIRVRIGLDKKPAPPPRTTTSNPTSPRGDTPVGPGENNPTSDTLSAVAWSARVEGNDYSAGGVGTTVLVWPKAPIKFPITLRIFYTADVLVKPLPTFESSTDKKVSVSDWSTAKNGLTFTIRSGEVDENSPLRIRVYATTQLGVAKITCLSCK